MESMTDVIALLITGGVSLFMLLAVGMLILFVLFVGLVMIWRMLRRPSRRR